MSIQLNSINVRRFNKYRAGIIPSDIGPHIELIAAGLHNLLKLGYTISADFLDALKRADDRDVEDVFTSLVTILKDLLGDTVKYEPMYPNFPKQVAEASDTELLFNALFHYFGDAIGARILPEYEKIAREPLALPKNLKVIDIGTPEEFFNQMKNLAATPVAYSKQDKEDLMACISEDHDIIPANFSNKENMIYMMEGAIRFGFPVGIVFKTATDVLRYATILCGGEVSLAGNVKFKLKRVMRKIILSAVEAVATNNPATVEDMHRHKAKWIKLGECLHPGEHKNKFSAAFAAFSMIRNGKIETFNSRVEAMISDKNRIIECTELLSKRPGEFARRLNQLMSHNYEQEAVVTWFEEIITKVKTKDLIEMSNYWSFRHQNAGYRAFMPKGSVAKCQAIEDKRVPIAQRDCRMVVEACKRELKNRWSKLPSLGKCYIDPELKGMAVPLQKRSDSAKSMYPMARGSRFSISPDKGTIRFFMYWKDISEGLRVDLDLSSVMFDDKYNCVGQVSYTNLRDKGMKSYHSGDITSAPDGASEFVDVDIQSAINGGARYILMQVNSYTGQNMDEIPTAWVGWMERDKVQSGEIYEPSTVAHKCDLSQGATIATPIIIDLVTREIIWVDLAIRAGGGRNVENTLSGTSALLAGMVNSHRPMLFDFYAQQISARGELVATKEEADVVFAKDYVLQAEELE